MAGATVAIWLLEIPGLPLPLTQLVGLSHSDAVFPYLLLMVLSLSMLLPERSV
ncbi:MAG: hypothetical protein NVS2B12_35640 [Ktedonobacteraceae bacterium]